jgi:hypothetical protein
MNRFRTKSLASLLLLIFYTFSCTYTYRNTDSTDEEEYYRKINNYGLDYPSIVILKNDDWDYCTNLQIAVDSTSWISKYNNEKKTVLTEDIYSITIRDQQRGAMSGILISFLFFALTYSTDLYTGPILSAYFLVGLITGAVFGSIISEKNVFIINAKESE